MSHRIYLCQLLDFFSDYTSKFPKLMMDNCASIPASIMRQFLTHFTLHLESNGFEITIGSLSVKQYLDIACDMQENSAWLLRISLVCSRHGMFQLDDSLMFTFIYSPGKKHSEGARQAPTNHALLD